MDDGNRNACIIQNLPEDVWCQIFSHLNYKDRRSTSLVCKLFFSIYSAFVRELVLHCSNFTRSDLETLLERYPGLKKLCINYGNLNNVLLAISISDLNLEKLVADELLPERQTIEIMSTSKVIDSIKSFKWKMFDSITVQRVLELLKLFPLLTKLSVINCHEWDDQVIQKVTSHLPNLRKLNLKFCYASDGTLAILSSNCPKLSSVNFKGCCKFTPEALYKFFYNNQQLRSVYMPHFENSHSVFEVSKMVECMQVLKNLSQLYLGSYIQDAIIFALAEARPPLKRLDMDRSFSQCTMAGLNRLLFACSGLEYLSIDLRAFENSNTHDAEMSIVVKRLPILKRIHLSSRVACPATLFSLVENCPLLQIIDLFYCIYPTEVHNDYVMSRPTKKNYSIKSITIFPKKFDISLWAIVELYCPNLERI